MAKDHSLRGASKYDPGGCEGGESCPLSSERQEEKPSQAVAVCGKSRTHGDNGGMGRHRSCAMKCSDRMDGKSLWLYQEASEPLGLSVVGRSAACAACP